MANGIAKVSLELLYHFQCGYCQGWWSIGDFTPEEGKQIYCPHCGLQNSVSEQVLLGRDFHAHECVVEAEMLQDQEGDR